mmetsp:Transcript_17131/g.48731  ORF Transcript_17131/g.48731 Transcript_17131/m.48731 type:complete len:205 (-) Transcript_17131:22-636(-)
MSLNSLTASMSWNVWISLFTSSISSRTVFASSRILQYPGSCWEHRPVGSRDFTSALMPRMAAAVSRSRSVPKYLSLATRPTWASELPSAAKILCLSGVVSFAGPPGPPKLWRLHDEEALSPQALTASTHASRTSSVSASRCPSLKRSSRPAARLLGRSSISGMTAINVMCVHTAPPASPSHMSAKQHVHTGRSMAPGRLADPPL